MSANKELKFTTIGVMSGSSCDGLDLCASRFTYELNERLMFKKCDILKGRTIEYPEDMQKDLRSYTMNEFSLDLKEFLKFDRNYCKFVGSSICEFYKDECEMFGVDVISIHGHTIVHDPEGSVTFQLGCNGEILIGEIKSHDVEGLSDCFLITNHRVRDVAINNGEGAPLVPIFDDATSAITPNNVGRLFPFSINITLNDR